MAVAVSVRVTMTMAMVVMVVVATSFKVLFVICDTLKIIIMAVLFLS